jgi:quercetin dioxygenase-like cupin family protein
MERFAHVRAGAGETYNVIGELLTFKVTNAETDGAFTAVELLAQPGGGPPLHTHPSSEIFTILEGEFEFTGLADGEPYAFRALPGDTVYIPGGAPHAYRAVGVVPGRTMLVLTPGIDMERFFKEAGVLVAADCSGSREVPGIPEMIAVGEKHGLTFLV